MGATYDLDNRGLQGGIGRRHQVSVSFDTSYTAGGEALTAADVGLGSIDEVVVRDAVTESGYVVDYDPANGTLVVYEGGGAGAPLAEVAGGTDLSTESTELTVRGRGSP